MDQKKLESTNEYQVSQLINGIADNLKDRVEQIVKPVEKELASEFREAADFHKDQGRQQNANMFARMSFIISETPQVIENAFTTSAGASMSVMRQVLRQEIVTELSRAFSELAEGLGKIEKEPDLFQEYQGVTGEGDGHGE